MRRLLPFLTILAVAALATPAVAAPPLRRATAPRGAYNLLLPASWRFRDASYPSDHFTHLWYLPANPLQKLEVVASGCVGCVSKNLNSRIPYPQGMLPAGVTSTYRISSWVLAYEAFDASDPYPDNGLIIVFRRHGEVSGSIRFDLWLPRRQHRLATTILNSIKAPGW